MRYDEVPRRGIYTGVDRDRAVEARARRAADDLAGAGTDVQYVRAIFVPEDELCLHLVDAASAEVANDLVRRAGISPDRIVEAAP